MIKLRVYLAGHSLEDEYRRIVKKEYGENIDLVDPISFHKLAGTDPLDIPPKDKELILSCHVLVAYIRKATFGTIMEIMFAYIYRIPVILIDMTGGEAARDIWIAYHISGAYYSIRSCFDYLLSHQLDYTEQKNKKKEIDMEKEAEVSTRILGKHYSPLIIRKTNKFGFPLFVGFICDYDMSDLDEVIEKLCVDTIADSFEGDEDLIAENPQALRNFAGELTDRFVKYYNSKHINCVEGVAVIFYADKMFISSLFGDFMNHAMCRQELYFALNFMTGV
jgi:hypothetical protein